MKKISLFACTIIAILPSFGLMACGSTYAKVTGIMAGIGTEQIHPLVYGNPLWDNQTIAENDYILQVGQDYLLGVTYAQSGGSIVCSISTESIKLKYDTEVLNITSPEETDMDVYYNLTCIKAVVNTAIIVEVDNKYTYTVIISAG